MHDKSFTLQILTPERVVFKGNTTSVVVPAYDGYLGVLQNHTSLISQLVSGIIKTKEGKSFKIKNGYLKVQKNNVIILGEEISEAE